MRSLGNPVDRALEAEAPETEQPRRHAHIPEAPFQIGDELPLRLTVRQMCRVFAISPSQFHRLERQGKFSRFELKPRIGKKAWSGKLLSAYLNGEKRSA